MFTPNNARDKWQGIIRCEKRLQATSILARAADFSFGLMFMQKLLGIARSSEVLSRNACAHQEEARAVCKKASLAYRQGLVKRGGRRGIGTARNLGQHRAKVVVFPHPQSGS